MLNARSVHLSAGPARRVARRPRHAGVTAAAQPAKVSASPQVGCAWEPGMGGEFHGAALAKARVVLSFIVRRIMRSNAVYQCLPAVCVLLFPLLFYLFVTPNWQLHNSAVPKARACSPSNLMWHACLLYFVRDACLS